MSESCFDAAWFKMLLCITLRLQTWPLHCLSLEMGTIFDTVATVLLLQVFERHCVVLKRVIIWRLREATQFNSVSFSFMIWLICLCHASSGNKTCIVTKEFWNFCRSFSCQFYRFCQFFWHFSFSVRFFLFHPNIPNDAHEKTYWCIPDTGNTIPSMCQFCVLKNICFLYSVCNTAVSAPTGQFCRVQMLCIVRVSNVAFLVAGFTMQSCFLKLYR